MNSVNSGRGLEHGSDGGGLDWGGAADRAGGRRTNNVLSRYRLLRTRARY